MAPSKENRIAVAMSGGVDSSVVASLLVEKYGKERVIGLTMKVFCYGKRSDSDKSCCNLSAIDDAGSISQKLGIPHYVIDLGREFQREIVDDFVSQYEKGLTPNPCIRCNDLIKFEHLLGRAQKIGCNILATGHYARITSDERGYHLFKGKDEKKDQSYFLAGLSQKVLSKTLFPLGDMTKEEVRRIAEDCRLLTAEKPESQDVCFAPDGIESFLQKRIEPKRGKIIDTQGNILGEHPGIAFYTIGQRKGLGGGFSEKMFVVGINAIHNEVIVGTEKELYRKDLGVTDMAWVLGEVDQSKKLSAKIRYQSPDAVCVLNRVGQKYRVIFEASQKAVTPGQTVVFYDHEEVVGRGIISLD